VLLARHDRKWRWKIVPQPRLFLHAKKIFGMVFFSKCAPFLQDFLTFLDFENLKMLSWFANLVCLDTLSLRPSPYEDYLKNNPKVTFVPFIVSVTGVLGVDQHGIALSSSPSFKIQGVFLTTPLELNLGFE
jgi:hypothetical protein